MTIDCHHGSGLTSLVSLQAIGNSGLNGVILTACYPHETSMLGITADLVHMIFKLVSKDMLRFTLDELAHTCTQAVKHIVESPDLAVSGRSMRCRRVIRPPRVRQSLVSSYDVYIVGAEAWTVEVTLSLPHASYGEP